MDQVLSISVVSVRNQKTTPEVGRTRLFNYFERGEETSSSVKISTVLKGNQDSSDKNQDSSNKNQDTQSALRFQAGDGVTEADSRSPVTEADRRLQSPSVPQNGQVMMLEAVPFNFYMCSF